MTVKIVSDSSCDIPADLRAALDITIVPIVVRFGDEEFRDGVTIGPSDMLNRIEQEDLPRFSQPSPGDFVTTYRRIASACGPDVSIVSIHVTSRVSGIFNTARLAAQAAVGTNVHVVDSCTGSMGAGWIVLAAARAAAAGQDRSEILDLAQQLTQQSALFYMIPDLRFLHRVGRIGAVQAWLGSSLSLHPIVSIQDGQVVPHRLARGRDSAIDHLIEAAVERFGSTPVHLAVVHVDAPAAAAHLLQLAAGSLNAVETLIVHAGATVTGSLGPGCIGICVMVAPDHTCRHLVANGH